MIDIDRAMWLTFDRHLAEARKFIKGLSDVRYLPWLAIDHPDFAEALPSIPAVYFICRPGSRKPLYIGRTTNLKRRWTRDLGANACSLETEHHRLKAALKLKNAALLWMQVSQDYLGIVEMMLIQMHKPRWNVVRR
jgi:excinuclease UvrABC nuclease subunit